MKKVTTTLLLCALLFTSGACSDDEKTADRPAEPQNAQELSLRNMTRAMELVDNAITNYFDGEGMKMSRSYNPYNGQRSDEVASVWMYGSSIEAVNAILRGLKSQHRQGITELYDAHYQRYVDLLGRLFDNADYYRGTYTLTSYTQTREWEVYAVNRGSVPGSADVTGVLNVYDDQEWLVREFIEAYRITGEQRYLDRAEYLAQYVLDGWDCTLDEQGRENGGITWGPGYTTKHACSNGPIVAPLVWLHEIYKGRNDTTTRRYIDSDRHRLTESVLKSDYYLDFAKKVYAWQKSTLLRPDGVYYDMRGGNIGDIRYEEIDGQRYRANTVLTRSEGEAYSYNCGSMLSGAADLYRATGAEEYRTDFATLTDASFSHFARLGQDVEGYYTYSVLGFNDWFNGVMMRGWLDGADCYEGVATPLASFQRNLDYAYEHFHYGGMLPTNLLVGWNQDRGKNATDGQFIFAFAAQYASLARYEIEK